MATKQDEQAAQDAAAGLDALVTEVAHGLADAFRVKSSSGETDVGASIKAMCEYFNVQIPEGDHDDDEN